MAARRILLQQDLHPEKGIPWDRSSIYRKVKDGTFPPPDGKTTDSRSGKNFWFESTIDNFLRAHAKKMRAARQAAERAAAAAE
jgi:predicted DNA-binding transcriptional regulator AlpA